MKLSKDTGIETTFKEGKAYMTRNRKNMGRVIVSRGLPYLNPEGDDHPSVNANLNAKEGQAPTKSEADDYGEIEGDNPETTPDDSHTCNSPNREKLSIGKPIHDDCAHLLHRKLGHISFPVIQKMIDCSDGLKVKGCKNYLECSM